MSRVCDGSGEILRPVEHRECSKVPAQQLTRPRRTGQWDSSATCQPQAAGSYSNLKHSAKAIIRFRLMTQWKTYNYSSDPMEEGCGGGGHWLVAHSRMVCMSASVKLPLHHKVQKFSSDTGWPRWSRKKGRKTVVVVWYSTDPMSLMIWLYGMTETVYHCCCYNYLKPTVLRMSGISNTAHYQS